jgi:uncharacterized protein (DUF885 family)
MKWCIVGAALLALAGCDRLDPSSTAAAAQAAVPRASTAARRLNTLVEDYFEHYLELDPLTASSIGDHRYDDRLPNNVGEAWLADALALEQDALSRLREIDANALDAPARVTYDVFKYGREMAIEGFRYPRELLPVDQFSSLPLLFAQMGSGGSIQPFASAKDYDNFLKRVDGFTVWIDQAIVNMRRGLENGVVQPKVLVEKMLPQLDALSSVDPQQSVFFQPLAHFPEKISTADRQRLTKAYRAAVAEKVAPAYRRLHDFLQREYLPKARDSAGLGALPNGAAWYNYLIRLHTTTQFSADEIHALGLKEVARLRGEIEHVRSSLRTASTDKKSDRKSAKGEKKEDAGGKSPAASSPAGVSADSATVASAAPSPALAAAEDFKSFLAQLRSDPAFRYQSPAEILEAYRALKEQVAEQMPALFSIAPKNDFEIRPMEAFREKSAPSAEYQMGTPDGSRPGVFYVNTYDLASRPKYMTESIYLHEAVPGHHFQLALQYEIENLPRFRRFGADTAYVEGWGLYAESLGKELGRYQDPYQYIGALTAEIWRACRLVVDTGMHAKGWSREQAIAYLRDNSAIGEADVVAEIERYMAIPGQALAYKIGQLKLRELRSRAEQKLGENFDVREFHTQILQDGSLPLSVLQAKTDRWLAAQKK